jgi:predicted nucleic acid-binding Zn ribbon protein
MANETCSQCGSEYRILKQHIPMKDTDTEDCQVCGNVLRRWSKSTTIYSATLVLKRENHLKKR